MNNHKKLVLTLYRTHLRFCINELKYKPLDWRDLNTVILYDYSKMSLRKRKQFIRNIKQEDLGANAANTIRHIYKQNMKLTDKKSIDECLNYGFHIMRRPYLFYRFEKSYLEDIYLYN